MTNFNFLLNNLSYLSSEDLVGRPMDSTCFRSAPVPLSFRLRLHPLRMVATLLLILCFGVGNAWGADVTYTFSSATNNPGNGTEWYSDDIDAYTNWSATAGDYTPKYYSTGSGLRVYNGGNFSISSTKTISSITLTFSGTSYTFSTSNTTTPQTVSPNSTSYEWSVSRTCRLQKIEITYAVATPYTVRFYKTDGTYEDRTEASAGAGVTPPSMDTPCDGWAFQGWSKSQSTSSTSTTVLSTETLTDGKYYPNADITLYPVYTKEVEETTIISDVLTNSTTGISGTTYTAWSNKTSNSDAVYAGKSAGQYTSIQLNASSPNGFWTTSSGGIAKKVIVEWNSNTANARVLQIFGKSSKYASGDLYSSTPATKGTNIGTITNGTTTEVTLSADYAYIGLRSSSNALYLDKVTIQWETEVTTTYYYSYPTCCTPLGSINGSVSWTNPTEAVVTWDKLDDQVSAWALSWSPNTAGSSITSAIADYGLTQKTATVSGLACGTEYTFTLTPTLKSGVCTPASNPTIESTSTKYSITRTGNGTVTGGSFTTKISSDAVTSACNGSTISIAATPSTGYEFTSWTITNDDNSDADVTSTLLGAHSTTASTSFTMPSHRVTITPSFSCIEPEIDTNPASASYTEGASPSALTVAATLSSGTLTYKWQKSTNSGVSWTDESGTGYNTATYAAANISTSLSANGVQYRCIVGNSEGGCTVTSGVATITVTEASRCVAPTFSVSAGTYNSLQTVMISSSTSGSTIYYTTDGSTPTTSSSHGTEGEASASVTVSSSQTVKAIAVKDGMTDSDVSEAAYVICSTDPTFSTTSSSNITITGARITCGGITKGTCDIDAYGIVYGTSANPTGNAQQKGTDASTNVSSYYVDLTSLTAGTTYYARPYATVNGKTVYGTEISFTTLNTPVIKVSETSRAFGTRKVNDSYKMTFTVSGSYLQDNIGLAVGGTNSAMFSVDKTSLTPSTGTVSTTTITVTYTPTAAGSHSASISLTSTYATTKTVTLSGTGRYEDIYLTAMHEGVTAWSDYASGVTKAGDGYTIPNPGDIAAGDREGTGCEGIHYHFAGWVTNANKEAGTISNNIIEATGTKDASNTTYWAVWEKESDSSSPVTYTKVTSAPSPDWGGTYLFVRERSSTKVAVFNGSSAAENNYIAADQSSSVISSSDDMTNCEMTIIKHDGDAYYSLKTHANKYLSGTAGNNALLFQDTDTANFSISISSNKVTILQKGFADGRGLQVRNQNKSGGTSPQYTDSLYTFKVYDKSEQQKFCLYKKAGGIVYDDPKVECICSENPSAGTAAVDAEGTFSASSIAVKATGASTGHADCSYTDYGFVWSSSVSAAAELKLVEGTGAASTNCTKVPVGNDGQATTFAGSISGSFTANNPIYVRSYVKNGKAEGTYQYSSVVTITPRSVTFNLNGHGSSTPDEQFVNNGSKATDPSYTESVTGYIFGGWHKEVGCTNQWNFASDVVSGESKTLYAKWTPISYSVRFNNNDENYLGDATGSMENESYHYDENKALTANGFSLAGYDFAGWALTPTGAVAHSDEAVVGNLSSTNGATVNLYAIWSPKNYDVTLAATDETSSVGNQTVTATYNAAMPTTKKGEGAVVAPSRTGYTFAGWEYSSTTYYNYNAGTSTLSSAHVWDQPNSTTTLTPKWSINSYTLRWDLDGGTVSVAGTGAAEGATGTPSSSVVYNSAIILPTVTKAGYNFAGWDVTPADNMPASDVTYTATWTAKTLNSISLAEAEVSVYVGEIKYVNVIYDPSDILTKGFTQVATPSYCQIGTYASNMQAKITGGRGGVTITEDVTETVSIKANADNTKTASISVTVKPLPRVHFVDNIHNESFADVVATIDANELNPNKSMPTHDDVDEPGTGNSCEKTHLHLIGWIRGDWPAYIAYMNGTGDAPSVSELTSATGYWFLPDADINTETYNGKTFYAVWAVEE